MKMILLMVAVMISTTAKGAIGVTPTVAPYSPTKNFPEGQASWNLLVKRSKGYIVNINAAVRFQNSISDYITCEFPGMTGQAGTEKIRFSITFGETKTFSISGFVPGATVQLKCISESQNQLPVILDASMTSIAVDQAYKR